MEDSDIHSFASQLQKSIEGGLLPTQSEINDITKQITENLNSGEIDSAINIVGGDKVKELSTQLTTSAAMYEKIKNESLSITHELTKANTEHELEEKILQQMFSLNDRIANAQNLIAESHEKLIPNLQSELVNSQTKLSLMEKTDAGYADQLNVVKEIGVSIENEKLRIADIAGQQTALVKLRDEELSKATDLLGQDKSIYDMRMEITKNSRELIKTAKEHLDVTSDLENIIEGLGDNMKELLEDNKDLIKEFHNEIDAMQSGILNTIKKIPLIGGILATSVQKPLEEATKIVKEKFTQGFLKMQQEAAKPGATLSDSLKAGADDFVGAMSGIGGMISSVLTGPVLIIGSIVALLALAFSRFQALEKTTAEFRDELGLSYGAMEQIQKDAISVNKELAYFGVSIEDAVGSAKALVEEFGNVNHVTRGQIELVSKLSAGLGISQDAAAGALVKFMEMGAPSDEVAKNLTLATAELSNLAGVPAGKVMEDVANASEDAILAIGNMPRNLAAAAVEARRMGSSLDSAAKTASHLLDFESSISSEMKLASMMGRHVNFGKMRQLAMEGDLAGMQKEQLRIMKEMGGYDKMNRWQKQALAEALGTSVEELTKMNKIEKENAEFARENPELAAKYQKQLEALRGGEEKSLAKSAEERMAREIQQEKMNALQNQFNQMMVELGEALLPVINGFMSALVPILKAIGFLLKFIVAPFALIGDLIAAITGDTDRLKERFSNFGSTAITIIGTIGVVAALAFGGAGKAASAFFGGLSTMAKGALNLMGGLGDKVKGMFGGSGTPAPSGPTPSGTGAFGRDPVKSATPKATPGANKGPGFADKFAKIDTTGLLKAAGALAILAGALYISAKAFQEFGEVTWGGVVKGLVAIGALVFISKSLSKGSADMIRGAASVAILGAALIPAAFAFQMFANVPFSAVLLGIGAITALAVVAGLLGKFSPLILAGAGALAAVGGAMLVFGLAAMAFATAVNIIASAFGKVIETIQSMSMGDIGMIYALGSAFAFIGIMSPLLLAAAIAIGVLGIALIPFSVGLLAAGIGISIFAFGVKQLVDISGELPAAALGFGMFIGIMAMLAPIMAMAAIGLAIFSLALIPFGIGIAIAGAGVALFGIGMSLVMDTLRELPEAAMGLLLFAGAMALIAPLTPLILTTAAALAILGVALIPLSIAMLAFGAGVALVGLGFKMLRDAKAPELLIDLAMAVSLVGLMIPFIALGAIAIGIMTVALIPFSIALLAAGVGMALFGLGLSLTADALNDLSGNAVENLFAVGLAVAALGPLLPFIIIGAISLAIMASSLIAFGAAALIAGLGLEVLGGGLESSVEYLGQLAGMAGQLGMASIAIYSLAGALTALSLAQIAQSVGGLGSSIANMGTDFVNAINPFRDASEEASKGPFDEIMKLAPYAKDFVGLGYGIEKLAIGTTILSKLDTDSLDAVSESIRNLRNAFSGSEDATILGSIKNTASGFIDSLNPMKDTEEVPITDTFAPLLELFYFADQAFLLGVGLEAVASGLNQIANVDISPLQQLKTVIPELMSSLLGDQPKAKEPEGFASSIFSGFSSMFGGDDGEEKPKATQGQDVAQSPLKKMVKQLNEFSTISDDTLGILDLISYSMARLAMALTMINMEQVETIIALGESFSQIGRILPAVQRGTSALKMVAGSVMGVEKAMRTAGPALETLVNSLTKLANLKLSEDMGEEIYDGLKEMGDGIEEFLDYLDDGEMKGVDKLASSLDKLIRPLNSLSGLKFEGEVGPALKSMAYGIEQLTDYLNDGELDNIDKLTNALPKLADSLKPLSSIKMPEGWGVGLTDLGSGLEDFLDYLNDGEFDVVTGNFVENLSSLGKALGSFSSLNVQAGLGDQLDIFGEGLEDFIDYMDDADLANVSASLSVNLTSLGSALRGFSNFNISSNLGDQLEYFGEGLEDFIDYMDDADLAKVSSSLGKNLSSLGSALTKFSSLNIKSNMGDTLENFGEGLEEFIDYLDDGELSTVTDKFATQMTSLGNAISSLSGLKISEGFGSTVKSLGSGIEQFLDYLNDNEMETMTNTFSSQMLSLSSALKSLSGIEITEQFGENLQSLGHGIEEFLDYLNDDEMETMTGTFVNQMSLLSNSLVSLSGIKISSNFGNALTSLGKGVEQFSDYLNDGEGKDIGNFFRQTGPSLVRFVDGVSKLGNIKEISLTESLRDLSKLAGSIDSSSVQNVELLSSKLVDALNSFSNVGDPVVESLKAINAELYSLCENIEKLNVEKLQTLKQVGISVGSSGEGGGFLPPNVNSEADMIRLGIGDGLPTSSTSLSTSSPSTSSVVKSTQSSQMQQFKEKLRTNFMNKVGGEDTFNEYTGTKDKLKSIDAQLANMKATNMSAPVMGGETDFNNAYVVGYKDEQENSKFKELQRQRSETGKQQRKLKNEMLGSYKGDATGMRANRSRSMFGLDLLQYENEEALKAVEETSISQEGQVTTETSKSKISISDVNKQLEVDAKQNIPLASIFTSPPVENQVAPNVDEKYELFKRTTSGDTIADLQSYTETNNKLIKMGESGSSGTYNELDVDKFKMENSFMERLMKEKAEENFKSHSNSQVPSSALNVFDWNQDESGNVNFGDPSMGSITTKVAPGEAFNPFSLAENTDEIETGIQIEQIAQSVDSNIPMSPIVNNMQETKNIVDTREVSDGIIEKKLTELISLMKSGGISVNLDGKKVSSAIAKVQPD
jgi:hypothetical protein